VVKCSVWSNKLAYKQRGILEAKGKIGRFRLLLPQYQFAPEVTRERLYLDSMQLVLKGTNKVLVDSKSSNNMMYLPLDKLMEKSKSDAKSRQGNSTSSINSSSSTRSQNSMPIDSRPSRGQRQGRN